MTDATPNASFERLTDTPAKPTTLVEGLPGHGLVAAIAVDLVTRQLDLDHHGTVTSPAFPRVASFADGRVRDPVRVYAGDDPAVMTLQSDVALDDSGAGALAEGVLDGLADRLDRVVLLVGAPAESQQQVGDVAGIATSDGVARDLSDAGIALAEGSGLVGGATGSLLAACHQRGVPAAALVVRANPYIPDPRAARAVIEDALEPLVDFDIDTAGLEADAHQIEDRLEQMAEQYRRAQMSGAEEHAASPPRSSTLSNMYQ
ncbi:proteasome assembly chaperone family protein [Halarchaeum sp. CBA1220]|uniref:proteasome assembly chaperone family protein n=1 Tax=Halarchaeum sp. CBA1220 TaxID=1853682 RepID=UPI000F3A9D85|nr:PAC2 family protein [Halarchaeum sp. CBA1220]QLC34053.1 proteasome assembly chaperone family protein [Halarchaeum sp. CBA1220]